MSAIPAPLLIVSPHLDDAALSCAALLDGPERPDVLTVLAGIPDEPRVGWSERHMGFPDSTATMTARRVEENAALGGATGSLELMELLDADYLDGERSGADAEALHERVSSWLAAHPGGAVALPAGAGRRRGRIRARLESLTGGPRGGVLPHDDHLFVRDAALPAIVSAGPPAAALLYEELPYMLGGGAERGVLRLAASLGLRAEPLELHVDVARKAERIAHYASQLGHLAEVGPRLDDPGAIPASERYWILRPS